MLRGRFDSYRVAGRVLYNSGEIDDKGKSIILLTGANGTGKSTLLKQLFMQNADQGIYVEQDNNWLLSQLSIKDNIMMGQSADMEDCVIELLQKLNMEELLHKKVNEISGGEERIICLLRGIVSDANIIFMDEPTNDLDYRVVSTLLQIIENYKTKKLFIIVTHDKRLYEMADCIYCIEDKEVKCLNHVDGSKLSGSKIEHKERKIEYKPAFFQYIFNRDIISYFLIGIFIMVSMGITIHACNIKKSTEKTVKDNQINICNTLYASSAQLLRDGYLPTSCLKYFNVEDIDKWNIRDIEKEIQDCINRSYSIYFNLDESDKYSVYNVEYYDLENDSFYNVFNTYLRKNGKEKNSVYLNTTDAFFIDGYFLETQGMNQEKENLKEVKINLEQLKEAEESIKISDKIVPCLSYIILDKNESFYDFIQSEQLREMWDANYFIKSKETCQIIKEANRYVKLKKSLTWYLTVIGIILMVEIVNSLIHVKIKKKAIRILRDYGFEAELVRNEFVHRYNKKIGCYAAFVLVAVTNVGCCVLNGSWNVWSNYMFAGICLFTVVLIYLLRKALYTRMIDRVYSHKQSGNMSR